MSKGHTHCYSFNFDSSTGHADSKTHSGTLSHAKKTKSQGSKLFPRMMGCKRENQESFSLVLLTKAAPCP